jgi:hypothetical protein
MSRSIFQKILFPVVIGSLLAMTFHHALDVNVSAQAPNGKGPDGVKPSRANVKPTDPIEITLDTSPMPGGFALLLNDIDVTGLVQVAGNTISYSPNLFPLPIGESRARVYMIGSDGAWTLSREVSVTVAATSPERQRPSVEFTPTVSINLKGERNVTFFPATARPERPAYSDTAGQGGFQVKVTHLGWTFGGQFDFAGSSRKQEALRFGELANKAPSIDLSSYRVEIGKGRFRTSLGHISFGSNRHLINSFSSRGLGVTVPIGKQNEVTFSAMNGTSIVGFDNFAGLSRADHNVLGVTFAREFIRERPGGLRLEVTAMRGSLLPLNSFNRRTINDAEKSYGGAVRLQFKTKDERLRFEGGYTRSRFTNRADPSLEQGQQLTQIIPVTKGARFVEASFDLLKDKKLFDERKLTLTGTFRHEEIEPLFKSIGASSQSDKRQNQFEVTANFGDISFVYGNLRDRDNLLDLISMLTTLNRRNNLSFAFSPGTLFTPTKPIKFLPRISYTIDHLHQCGLVLPSAGLFNSASQVPDQMNTVHGLGAELPITDKLRVSYRYSHAFQDNRQPGRERSDQRSSANVFNVTTSYFKNIQIGFDLSRERQSNLEVGRKDRQFRFGSSVSIQDILLKNLGFAINASTSLAGDTDNKTDSENLELDAQATYRLAFGKKAYRKMSTQFFVRYSNRHGLRIDRTFTLRDLSRNQGFNAGMTVTFF